LSKITIDNIDYDTESFSEGLRAEVAMLQLVERRINELKGDLVMFETSKLAYTKRVAELLKIEHDHPTNETLTVN
jgi:hypothetical protein